MRLPIYQVDAFTSKAFGGNSAAIIFLEGEARSIPTETLQLLAMENNLSETAYIQTIDPSESVASASNFGLRWFTPTIEAKLCGHATLASAAAIWKCTSNASKRLTFQTLSGELAVEVTEQGKYAMDFPLNEPAASPLPEGLELDSSCIAALAGSVPVKEFLWNEGLKYGLLVVGDKNDLVNLTPDLVAAQKAKGTGVVGIIATSKGDGESDFFYRFFAPWAGIDEDPVTGSAATVAGPYWSKQLKKLDLKARQLSKREGDLWLTVKPDAQRIIVSGEAVLVLEGHMLLNE